jgi:hypothetical protein
VRYKYIIFLTFLIVAVYWQFFFLGKIPIPADTLVGSYFPWLDYKWGNEVGVAVKNPPISDVFSQFFLWKYLGVDFIKQGQWPLWNPYSSSGTPLLATYHSAPLLPFNFLLIIFPKYFGWGVYIFAQTLAAALGMYFLLRFYVKNDLAKVGGAIIFSLSGLMTTWAEFGTGVWAAAMLPWIFYGIHSFLNTQRYRYLLLICIAFVCLFLAGHAQLTFYSCALFLIFLFVNSLKSKITLKSITPVLFLALSIGISLIVFLPAFDFSKDSIRSAEAYSATFNYGLSNWIDGIRLLAADFFGNPSTYNHWGKASYHEQASFLGTISLALIIATFLLNRFKDTSRFWTITFLISLFLAFDTLLTRLIYSQPFPLLTYSSASRIFFISSFSGAILAAQALEKLSKDQNYLKYLRRSSFFLIIVIVIYLIIVLFNQNSQNLLISTKNSILPIGLLILTFILSFVIKKRDWFVFILVALIFFDLSRYFLKYNPFVPSDYVFPKTPLIEFLQKQTQPFRITRIDEKILPPNTWIAYGLSSVEGYDPLSLENYSRYFNLVNGNKYTDGVSRYIEVKRFPSKYLDDLNTKYFLTTKENLEKNSTASATLTKVFEDKNSVILENPTAKERAYFTQGNGKINSINYFPNKIKIETQGSGFLVLAETYHKDWRLYLNGQATRISQVNGALQGIIVPEGQNILEFNYLPKSFDLGLKLSVVSIVIIVLVNIFLIAKRKW